MLRTSCRSFPGNLRRKGGEERRGTGAVGEIFGRGPMGLCKGGVRQLTLGGERGREGRTFNNLV